MSEDKRLFKLWVENIQMKKFEELAKQQKVSVAWLMRRAFDEFLAKQKGKR